MAKIKVQITLDEELLKDVDDYCDKNYMNRSWFISSCCNRAINEQKLIDSISNLSLSIRKCAEQGSLDEATIKDMETYESLAKLFIK